MADMGKALVFIDAGYLTILSKHFGRGKYLRLDILRFARHLAAKHNLWMEHMFYYTAPPFQSSPPTREEAERKAGYDSFVFMMKADKSVTIREGRCQKIGGEYCQKGVDTLLTMDLTTEPVERGVDTVIILACDTDFVPVLNYLKAKGNRVILYFYTDKVRDSKFSMSNHLYTACSSCIMLAEEDFTENLR